MVMLNLDFVFTAVRYTHLVTMLTLFPFGNTNNLSTTYIKNDKAQSRSTVKILSLSSQQAQL